MIHLLIDVDLQQPIPDLLLFLRAQEVFDRHIHVIWRWDIGHVELIVVAQIVVIGVIDKFIDVEVAVQED